MARDESISDDLLEAIGREVMRVSRPPVVAPAGTELDLSAFRLLWLLREAGPLTIGHITERLQLEQSTVSRQVKAALEHGLVLFDLQEGVRGKIVRATPMGEQAFERDLARRAEIFRNALGALGVARVRRLAEDLGRLNDALAQAHHDASEPTA